MSIKPDFVLAAEMNNNKSMCHDFTVLLEY